MADPERLVQAQMALWQSYAELWQRTAKRFLGEPVEPLVVPDRGDKRFRDAAWDESALFDYVKQSYLLTARWMQSVIHDVEGMDPKTAQQVDFYTPQFTDALAQYQFSIDRQRVW